MKKISFFLTATILFSFISSIVISSSVYAQETNEYVKRVKLDGDQSIQNTGGGILLSTLLIT